MCRTKINEVTERLAEGENVLWEERYLAHLKLLLNPHGWDGLMSQIGLRSCLSIAHTVCGIMQFRCYVSLLTLRPRAVVIREARLQLHRCALWFDPGSLRNNTGTDQRIA